MPDELLLKGGTLVTAADTSQADLLVRDGRIAGVGRDLVTDGETVDLRGRLVLPGAIDTHVHLAHSIDRLGIVTADDFHSGTVAAACGGVTTIIDFAVQHRGESLEEAVVRRLPAAEGQAVVDFGLHVIVTDVRDDVLDEIPKIVRLGCPSLKIYMTYSDKVVDDGGLLRVLERTAEHGGLVYVHCEND
ncbi:MAG TPA: amidohydrolase family protein, partial [Dehalococcoidia bacterium]|nr:amidohydrolase family protein [Dehalococcoidia bacterium]